MYSKLIFALAILVSRAIAVGYRTVGSSGVAPQMMGLTPYTTKVVIIDKFHPNYGYPTVNLDTGEPGNDPWKYDGTDLDVFGSELDWKTNHLRPLQPVDDTSCSIGAYFSDGTLLNIAGGPAGGDQPSKPRPGYDGVRTISPGPCASTGCSSDWIERSILKTQRWYPSAQTLATGDIIVVGGSIIGKLVLNEASINVPSYEIISRDTFQSSGLHPLPILQFTEQQNLEPGFSYNLYPILHLLPNNKNADQIFSLAGNRTVIWDYTKHRLVRKLPQTPRAARTFPSSSTSVLLPLVAPDYIPEILICGGASNDMPNPKTLNDCYTIRPYDSTPAWIPTDNMPNGPQVMSNGILLPDGSVLIVNGARKGCAGGNMADNPVFKPILYHPERPLGSRFETLPATSIPRMYHSNALLLPSGEVLVAGSNPPVGYDRVGNASNPNYPHFGNNGHRCALNQQQSIMSLYPTEYRVEIFSPPYIGKRRPVVTTFPDHILYGEIFSIEATLDGVAIVGPTNVVLNHPGFSTHGQNQGQRNIVMTVTKGSGKELKVVAPKNASVMPRGVYLLWVVANGVPSVGEWVSLQ